MSMIQRVRKEILVRLRYFGARLQECQAKNGPPTLIRIETSAGHGAVAALNKTIEKVADECVFLVKALRMRD